MENCRDLIRASKTKISWESKSILSGWSTPTINRHRLSFPGKAKNRKLRLLLLRAMPDDESYVLVIEMLFWNTHYESGRTSYRKRLESMESMGSPGVEPSFAVSESFERMRSRQGPKANEPIAPSTVIVSDWNLWRAWAHLELNQGPTGYEPAALTNWAMSPWRLRIKESVG